MITNSNGKRPRHFAICSAMAVCPPPGWPLQYDIDFEDNFAGDAGPMDCGDGNPCWWHGTGSAGVATGFGPPTEQRLADVVRKFGVVRGSVSVRYDKPQTELPPGEPVVAK